MYPKHNHTRGESPRLRRVSGGSRKTTRPVRWQQLFDPSLLESRLPRPPSQRVESHFQVTVRKHLYIGADRTRQQVTEHPTYTVVNTRTPTLRRLMDNVNQRASGRFRRLQKSRTVSRHSRARGKHRFIFPHPSYSNRAVLPFHPAITAVLSCLFDF